MTYSNNVCFKGMLDVRYQELKIDVSKAAATELLKHNMDLYDVKKVLEEGSTSPRKRKKETVEKWLNKGNKTIEVVVVKVYDEVIKQHKWLLIHCGIFTKK